MTPHVLETTTSILPHSRPKQPPQKTPPRINKTHKNATKAGDRLTVALARTIHLDGTAETGRHDASSPLVTRAASLMDGYEYVMHGRVFKYAGAGGTSGRARVEMIASFGGLLLKLGGEAAKLQLLEVDSAVYLLVRKL